MINNSDTEFLGFILKKLQNSSFAVVKGDRQYHLCSTETEAKKWVSRFNKMLARNTNLKQASEDLVGFKPPGSEDKKSNIAFIHGELQEEKEKSIKIISKKNAAPLLDIQNLDSNEVLGLMRRAEYMITNFILRNGSL